MDYGDEDEDEEGDEDDVRMLKERRKEAEEYRKKLVREKQARKAARARVKAEEKAKANLAEYDTELRPVKGWVARRFAGSDDIDRFSKLVKTSGGKRGGHGAAVFVKFFSPWCAASKKVAGDFDRVAKHVQVIRAGRGVERGRGRGRGEEDGEGGACMGEVCVCVCVSFSDSLVHCFTGSFTGSMVQMTKEEIDIKVVEFDCGDPSSQQFCKAEGVKSYPHIKMYDIENTK